MPPNWPWGKTTFPATGLVPCSDLAWAAGGWSPRWGVGAVLQHNKSSRLWDPQEDGEQVPDTLAGWLKHLPEPVPSSKVHVCAVSLKHLLFVAQRSCGYGELRSKISPGSSPHCVWLLPPLNTPASHWAHGACSGDCWPSALLFEGFRKAPASWIAFGTQLWDASALEREGVLEIPLADVSTGWHELVNCLSKAPSESPRSQSHWAPAMPSVQVGSGWGVHPAPCSPGHWQSRVCQLAVVHQAVNKVRWKRGEGEEVGWAAASPTSLPGVVSSKNHQQLMLPCARAEGAQAPSPQLWPLLSHTAASPPPAQCAPEPQGRQGCTQGGCAQPPPCNLPRARDAGGFISTQGWQALQWVSYTKTNPWQCQCSRWRGGFVLDTMITVGKTHPPISSITHQGQLTLTQGGAVL